jgi:chromosome condensin MukBEF MukE localization factor
MNRRLLVASIGGIALVAVTGVLIATADQPKGPPFIPGDQAVTEDLVRQKLQSEGYLSIQIVRRGGLFEAMGSKDGKTDKVRVNALTGRLASDDDDDDGDD